MRRRRGERALQFEVEELVKDVAAMLSGRVAQRWDSGDVPGWGWVNELAHADWETLAALADGTPLVRRSAWDGAVRFLAAEVVSAARSPSGLSQLQSSALIPLELDMLAGGRTPATPIELVQLVRDGIARAQGRRTHPSTS